MMAKVFSFNAIRETNEEDQSAGLGGKFAENALRRRRRAGDIAATLGVPGPDYTPPARKHTR
jgi:hypothetical protein